MPACAWCGAPLPTDLRTDSHVVRCGACGAGTTQPWPTEAELDAAYPDAYRPAEGRFSGPGDRVLQLTRGTLARRIDHIAPPGPVLDVGAGDGTLLRALQRRGRTALGLERAAPRETKGSDPIVPRRDGLGPWAPASETKGSDPIVSVRDATVEELEPGWAAIVMWHALEHLPAPRETVRAAAERLAPGGVLLVAVPNLDALQARLFGEGWLALDLPRHLTHLPQATLLAGLLDAGLTPERVSSWRGGQVGFGMLDGLVGRTGPRRGARPSLYDAVRRGEARLEGQDAAARRRALGAAAVLAPVAGALALTEIAMHRSGSTYVEARRGHR